MLSLHYGQDQIEVATDAHILVAVRHPPPPPPLADLGAAVARALEEPVGFPPLRRALTPDDHLVILVDDSLPRLEELLPPVLRHVGQAGVSPAAVTFLTPPSDENQSWLDNLPDDCDDVRVEVHAPKDRKKLSYLATTRGGRRLYVNRTVVDADQLILLCRPDADPLFAQGGAGLLFPTLSDEATRQELFHPERTPAQARALRTQAEEFAWLLGAPFLVQIIEGPADEIAGVIGGPVESHTEGERLYRAVWQRTVTELADTVVATVRGLGQRNRFASLARALAHASQMVQPEGRIILLSQADPHLGLGAEMLRQADDPALALTQLDKHKPADWAAAGQWAHAAQRARIYLLSDLPATVAEELFVTPLDHPRQLQRLLQADGSYLFLEDADKVLPTLASPEIAGHE